MERAFFASVTMAVLAVLVSFLAVRRHKPRRPDPDPKCPGRKPEYAEFIAWQKSTMGAAALANEALVNCEGAEPNRREVVMQDVRRESACIRNRHMGIDLAGFRFDGDKEAQMVDDTVRWCAAKLGYLPQRNNK